MTREEATKLLTQYIDYDAETPDYYEMEEACKVAIEALEKQPCEDCISRKNMLAVLRQSHSLTQAWDGFEKLPSVTPKEKTAAWVPTDEEPHEDYECNKCGYAVSTFTANIEPHTEYKYCPNCGARMVSE